MKPSILDQIMQLLRQKDLAQQIENNPYVDITVKVQDGKPVIAEIIPGKGAANWTMLSS